jgi:hypothetical protein
MQINIRAGTLRLILFLVLCSCSTAAAPSATELPTFSAGQNNSDNSAIPATATLAERVWATKPFGADQVAIVFSEPNCVGYQFGNNPVNSNCTGGGTVVAVQAIAADSTGQQYTLIAGRTLSDKITVVAIELDRAENMPIPVTDSGFTLVLPGTRRAIALVPIDQFGNLVGARTVLK